MSFRTDKLVLLLDTGTSAQVRQTAAKQLADLTLKTFRAPPPDESKDDLKPDASPSGDAKDGMQDVKPDLTSDEKGGESVTLQGQVGEDDAWTEVLDTIARLLPLLKSRSSETRSAASNALGLLASALPPYTGPSASSSLPGNVDESSSAGSKTDVRSLLVSGETLLASAGREYISKPLTSADKAKRRKAMMGSLGLGEVGWGDDVDQVIGEDEDDGTNVKQNGERSGSQKAETPTPAATTPQDIFEGLSARQITMLKRKKGDIVAEANKMRKLNAQVSGTATSATSVSETPTPVGSPKGKQPEAVTIDPGAKARAAAAAGGAVEPTFDDAGNPILPTNKSTLTMQSGLSPWSVVLLEIIPDLSDPTWQTRHGTALALLELLRSPTVSLNTPPTFLRSIARQLLSLLVLDRFGDFVGDTVIAPVRETAGQALGVLLKYLPDDAVYEVHAALLDMVRQSWTSRGKQTENGTSSAAAKSEGEKFRWEVRHAGLLGIKYEVAVRGDLLSRIPKRENGVEEDVKPAKGGLLQDIVDAAMMALRDVDDDVRTVAASALTPITDTLASELSHDELCIVVDTLWDCLAEGGDDLGSSTGAVMDLLGAMIRHAEVMAVMSESDGSGQSRQAKITRIYAFMRHPIATVRLAVARVLQTFTTAPLLSASAWHSPTLFSLLFQNLVLEERTDIRRVSFDAFISALAAANGGGGAQTLKDMIEDSLPDWYQMVMTPPGAKIDPSLITRVAKASSSHNVDKAMLEGDLSLVGVEAVMETRLLGARALALLRPHGVFDDASQLKTYLASPSAHQVYIASSVVTEWCRLMDDTTPEGRDQSLGTTDEVAKDLTSILLDHFERPLPATYSEMNALLKRIHAECQALLTSFSLEGKVSKDRIPSLPAKIDPLGQTSDIFTLSTAQTTVTKHFDALAGLLSKHTTKHVLPSLKDRRNKVMVSIGRYGVMKERYDVQVMSGVAGGLVALRVLPAKIGPVVKAIMESIKKEENPVLQARSATSIASLIHLCGSPLHAGRPNPSDKIVKNLFTFLCQDTAINPVFTTETDGIVSLKEDKPKRQVKGGAEEEETEEQTSMRVMRQGALLAFENLADEFGAELLDKVPKFWEGISQPLLSSFEADDVDKADEGFRSSTQAGQDVIDALTTLQLTAPHLDKAVQERVMTLFPHVIAALQSAFSVVRVSAAKCLAALCNIMTEQGMKQIVDHVVPLIGHAKRIPSRQGAVEAVHHIIQTLEIKALPYVLFLIVPILGRMSDPDESVRLLSTSTFASLVKMVPLEAGIPDPPGFSSELLAKRDEERKFLMQLLDGSKAEQYQIPIDIKADLRQYQRDGVSWLAFLAKYQLHGILCDDMGLGKSLQSICIIGSKHHERAQRHQAGGSVDSAHLPSLIVCPPTLCGHWYHEILKFTDYLRPVQHTGSAAQRALLRSRLTSPTTDVVITSYETVRADIDFLSTVDWLYCVLDEGHIIKNAKTKLSAAVKQIKAQHRLLLSGTPIQNNVLELWSLFDFLMPGFLGTERIFNDRFSKPILADRDGKASPKERELASTALEALHKQVLPFLLRRLKEDVLSDLPPKIIQDYHCELSDVQKLLYDEYSRSQAAAEAGEEVEGDGGGGGGGGKQQHVFQSLQYLRKLCNHPALVLEGEAQRTKQVLSKVGSTTGIHDIAHAPKLEALKQLLTDCGIGQAPSDGKVKDEMEMPQHRVLIFCQLRPMLDLIERDLFAALMPSVTYMRMDGSTDPNRRHAVVQTFNQDPRIDVLLLTTSVGGLGLNLTGADTVIFVDHDWNPMKDLQAMDRAHRLGQRKVVNVYRLITRGTLEEKIMGLQRFKVNIASSVVTQQNAGLGSMNTGEVLDLFKVSAEGEPQKKKESTGPVSASKVLEGLDDLPPEDEYAELSLSNFMSKV